MIQRASFSPLDQLKAKALISPTELMCEGEVWGRQMFSSTFKNRLSKSVLSWMVLIEEAV